MASIETSGKQIKLRKEVWRAVATSIETRYPIAAAHIRAEVDYWCGNSSHVWIGQGYYADRHNANHDLKIEVGAYEQFEAAYDLIVQLAEAMDDNGNISGNVATMLNGHKGPESSQSRKFREQLAKVEAAGQQRLPLGLDGPEPEKKPAKSKKKVATLPPKDTGTLDYDDGDPFADDDSYLTPITLYAATTTSG